MKRKTPNRKLLAAWNKRNRLMANGDKLCADGSKLRDVAANLCADGRKLRAKGDELWDEGNKLWSDGIKLRAEGSLVLINAVLAECGNTTIDYLDDGSCVLGTGEVLPAPKKEKP